MNPAIHLEFDLEESTEMAARVAIRTVTHPERAAPLISRLSGRVYGPVRQGARTLPTTFPLCPDAPLHGTEHSIVAIIPESCYWHRDAPACYEIQLELTLVDGSVRQWSQATGLRRAEVHGSNLVFERQRFVLRGVVAEGGNEAEIIAAKNSCSALLICEPSESRLQEANELGVDIVVDLRKVRGDIAPWLVRLTWHPSTAIVLLNGDAEFTYRPPRLLLCQAMPGPESPGAIADWANAVAVECDLTKPPPCWVSECRKPVLAIRRGHPYADVAYARKISDLMQATFAPQFDLAGYFAANSADEELERAILNTVAAPPTDATALGG
jgi:hypothetical protein